MYVCSGLTPRLIHHLGPASDFCTYINTYIHTYIHMYTHTYMNSIIYYVLCTRVYAQGPKMYVCSAPRRTMPAERNYLPQLWEKSFLSFIFFFFFVPCVFAGGFAYFSPPSTLVPPSRFFSRFSFFVPSCAVSCGRSRQRNEK